MSTEFRLGDYAYCQKGFLGHIEHTKVVNGRLEYSGWSFGKKWSSVKPTRKGKSALQLKTEYLTRLRGEQ